MLAIVPTSCHLQPTTSEIEAARNAMNIDATTMENLSRALAVSMWGMAPQKAYIGVDFNGFGAARLQLEGTRSLTLVPSGLWESWFSASGGSNGAPAPDLDNGKHSMHVIIEELANMSQAELTKFLTTEHAHHKASQITFGPGDLLYTVAGTLLVERTGNQPAYGLRHALMPGNAAEVKILREFAEHRGRR